MAHPNSDSCHRHLFPCFFLIYGSPWFHFIYYAFLSSPWPPSVVSVNGVKLTLCLAGNNTGYKKNDPTHPCRKCWDKFAKPFNGALLYADFSASSGSTGSNFQRPLFTSPPQPQAAPGRSASV